MPAPPFRCTWILAAGMTIGRAVEIPADCHAPRLALAGALGGARLQLEGSNDGIDYRPLGEPMRAPGVIAIAERRRFLRPRVAGCNDTTAAVLRLAAHRGAA